MCNYSYVCVCACAWVGVCVCVCVVCVCVVCVCVWCVCVCFVCVCVCVFVCVCVWCVCLCGWCVCVCARLQSLSFLEYCSLFSTPSQSIRLLLVSIPQFCFKNCSSLFERFYFYWKKKPVRFLLYLVLCRCGNVFLYLFSDPVSTYIALGRTAI